MDKLDKRDVVDMYAKPPFRRLAALAGAMAFSIVPSLGQAAELQNFIKDLYGGNGIFLAVNPAGFSHSAHFASDSLTELSNLNQQVASSVNLSSITPSLPSFTFDILQGMPSTTETSLGPVFGERAETIGQGKFNLSASFTHVHYTQLNGQNLDNIPILLDHGPVPGCAGPVGVCSFELDKVLLNIKLDVTRNVFAAYATYGITDRWDVSFIVPIVDQIARATSVATIINNSGTTVHRFDATHPSTSRTGGEATGFGDLIVRTKYNIYRGVDAMPDVSLVGQLNIPSGDQANLLGSGSTDVLGGVIISKQYGRIAPHLNLGYQVASGGYDRNNLLYVVGADFAALPNLTVGADFLGRQYSGGGGTHFNETDFSVGAKWRVLGPHILVADVIIPVNKSSGLRPDYIAFVGYQVTF